MVSAPPISARIRSSVIFPSALNDAFIGIGSRPDRIPWASHHGYYTMTLRASNPYPGAYVSTTCVSGWIPLVPQLHLLTRVGLTTSPPATFSGQIFRFLPNYPPSFLQLTSPWRLLILEGTRCAPSGMIAAALPDQEVRAVQFSLSCQPD